jgi:hypothetical protein
MLGHSDQRKQNSDESAPYFYEIQPIIDVPDF